MERFCGERSWKRGRGEGKEGEQKEVRAREKI